jgi:hypothetical protein
MDKHLAVQFSPPEMVTLDYFLLEHLYPIRRMIDALKYRYFMRDCFGPVNLSPQEERDALGSMFRLSPAQRKDLKFGILLAVPDARRNVWGGEEKLTFRDANRNNPTYWEMYRF